MRRFITVAAVSLVPLFTLSGCMLELGSGTLTTGGTGSTFILEGGVIGTPITGTYRAEFIVVAGGGACLGSGHATFTDAAGNMVVTNEVGQLCAESSGFTGSYQIVSGTGIYEGATGTGTSAWQITGPGAFTAQYIGSFEVPGTAPAASKRTFKMRATVSRAKRCDSERHCTSLDLATLRSLAR